VAYTVELEHLKQNTLYAAADCRRQVVQFMQIRVFLGEGVKVVEGSGGS